MKKGLLSLFVLICLQVLAAASFVHTSPEHYTPNEIVPIELNVVQGVDEVKQVFLQYWVEASLVSEQMLLTQDEPGIWRGEIPAGFAISEELYYLFEIQLFSGQTEHLPKQRGKDPFYILNPKMRVGVLSDAFVRLNEENQIYEDEDYLLVVSFLEVEDQVDKGCVKVFVDGKDVTKKITCSGSTFLYRESKPKPGIKKAIVRARLKGRDVYSETWVTEVLPSTGKKRIPILYGGSLNMAANAYNTSDKALVPGATNNDFATWTDFYASYGILELISQLYVSSLEHSNQQPINRYSIGLKIPYLEINAGDYSPGLSYFTMSGKNIRGIHGRFDSPYFKLDLVQGQTLRKTVFEDPASGDSSGSFRQDAIGGKLTVGDPEGFTFSLIGSRHRDALSSLKPEYYSYYEPAKNDSTLRYTNFARENAVLAADIQVNAPAQDVILGAEAAFSLLNRNINPGSLSVADWEDYDVDLPAFVDNLTEYFTINQYMEPLGLGTSSLAWKIYLKAMILNNQINLDYQETGSSFNSFGTGYHPKNTRLLSVSDQFNLGRYLYLNALYNRMEDNLSKRGAENNLQQLIFGQAMFRYPNWPHLKAGLNMNSMQNKENTKVESDYFSSYLQDSNTMNFAIGYDFYQIPYVPTQLEINYRMGTAKRESEATGGGPMSLEMDRKLSYAGFNMVNRFQIVPLRLYINYLGGNEEDTGLKHKMNNSRFYLRADYALFDGKLKPFVSHSLSSFSGDQTPQNYSLSSLGLSAYPVKKMSISTELGLKNHQFKDAKERDYTLTTWRLFMSQSF